VSKNEYWIDWDKPTKKYLFSVQELMVSSRQVVPLPKTGGFHFDDGSVQNWTLDQLYDQNENPMQPVLLPGFPSTGPFQLLNSQNLALDARTTFLATADPKITKCNIYLVSPDLSQNASWQNISGYAIDLHRKLTCAAGDPMPPPFWCQLQIYLKNNATGAIKHLSESTGSPGTFSFHEIELDKPYHIEWKPPSLNNSGESYTVTKLRIRLTSRIPSSTGTGELPLQGSWLVGNIVPL
jgi:hypothetical protein